MILDLTKRVHARLLANMLWELTLRPVHEDVLDDLRKEVDQIVVDRAKVEHELLLYRMSMIDFFLMRAPRIRSLHGAKQLVVLYYYLAFCKSYVGSLNLDEDTFLAEFEERASAYNKALDLWSKGMESKISGSKRPPESVLPVEETFASFCGIKQLGISHMLAFDCVRDSVFNVVSSLLEKYRIVCSAEEIKAATGPMERAYPGWHP